jgi:hypothetical protein
MHPPTQKFIKQSIASRLICPCATLIAFPRFREQRFLFLLIEHFVSLATQRQLLARLCRGKPAWIGPSGMQRSFLRGNIILRFHILRRVGKSRGFWLHFPCRRTRFLAHPGYKATLCRCVYDRSQKREASRRNAKAAHRISPNVSSEPIHCTLRG